MNIKTFELTSQIQLAKDNKDDNKLNIEGVATRYNELNSHNIIFKKGCLDEKVDNLRLFWQHDDEKVIGKVLKIEEKEDGMYFKGVIYGDKQLGKDAISDVKNGLVNELSIGITCHWDNYEEKEMKGKDGKTKKYYEINKGVKLHEISLVTFPSSKGSVIQKTFNDLKDAKDIENKLGKPLYDKIREISAELRQIGRASCRERV